MGLSQRPEAIMSAFTQDLMAIGIGLLAALYLAHRWWPGLKGLVQNTPGTQACGQTQGESTSHRLPNVAQVADNADKPRRRLRKTIAFMW